MRRLLVYGLWVIVIIGIGVPQAKKEGSPAQGTRQIRFGKIIVRGAEEYEARFGNPTEIKAQGKIRLEAPDQGLVFTAPTLTAEIETPEGGETRLKKAHAEGGITVQFDQKVKTDQREEKQTVRGRARTADYEDKAGTLILKGNVFAEVDSETRTLTYRNGEQGTIFLKETPTRVLLEGDPDRMEMEYISKTTDKSKVQIMILTQ